MNQRDVQTNMTCWFLTGSQELYGPATLAQVADQSRQVVEHLNSSAHVPVHIEWRPVLTGEDAIRRACLDASADDSCIGVIAWMHTFSPARAWVPGLGVLTKPLLHLHTQVNRSLPWSEIDMDFMNLNQAAHGDREFGYIGARMGLARKVVAGHASDISVQERVGGWVRAARGWAAGRALRLARFGDNMRNVAVTEGDKVEAQLRLGVSVNAYSVNDLAAAVAGAAPAAVDRLVQEYQDSYDVEYDLTTGGDRHQSLRDAAAIEVGLRAFLEEGGFQAFTTNFEDLGDLKQLPGIAVQRLMADGYGFGAEGDWKTAALLRVVSVMCEDGPGRSSFMEDYTYHLGPGEPKVLGAHMLEVSPSITTRRPRCEVHPLAIGAREDPVRLVFDADPGPGWVAGLLDLGDRLRLVSNDIEVVPPDEPLPRLPVARAVWKPQPDLATSAECWIMAGGPHHTVLNRGLSGEALDDLAVMAGIEHVHIDASSNVPSLRRELRAADAYFRMAHGVRG